ncbi:hypothetical protein [Telluribacter sp. SYSU D00476]|uniref:hypothetical protein n=1 Tax=Telluribacter sp. SYSU D00476 TaxID=2811430 RepID=UPI001FF429C4|nr:hypothetical protein [Telluribacter sp. SYSU D00476]
MINKENTDLLLFLITLVVTPIFCLRLYRHPLFNQKKGFIMYLSFLAMYPLINMIGHIVAISIFTYLSIQDGTFIYTFRTYSLQLYGVVFALINGYTLACIKQLSRGNWHLYKSIVRMNGLQIVLIFPSFFLNPLALLPTAASLLIIISLAVAKRKSEKQEKYNQIYKPTPVEIA